MGFIGQPLLAFGWLDVSRSERELGSALALVPSRNSNDH